MLFRFLLGKKNTVIRIDLISKSGSKTLSWNWQEKIVFWNTTTSHHVAFRVMMQLMGTEIDRRVDYTYEDIHRIVEKNWRELVKTSIVHKI